MPCGGDCLGLWLYCRNCPLLSQKQSTGLSRAAVPEHSVILQGPHTAPEALGARAPIRDQPGAPGSAADHQRAATAARGGRQRPRCAQAGAAA